MSVTHVCQPFAPLCWSKYRRRRRGFGAPREGRYRKAKVILVLKRQCVSCCHRFRSRIKAFILTPMRPLADSLSINHILHLPICATCRFHPILLRCWRFSYVYTIAWKTDKKNFRACRNIGGAPVTTSNGFNLKRRSRQPEKGVSKYVLMRRETFVHNVLWRSLQNSSAPKLATPISNKLVTSRTVHCFISEVHEFTYFSFDAASKNKLRSESGRQPNCRTG